MEKKQSSFDRAFWHIVRVISFIAIVSFGSFTLIGIYATFMDQEDLLLSIFLIILGIGKVAIAYFIFSYSNKQLKQKIYKE